VAILASDMLDLRFDADGDLYIGPNGPELIGGIEGVVQLAVIQIKLLLGEWFANLDEGFPWFQEFLGEKFTPEKEARLRALVHDRMVRKVPGATGVLGLSVSLSTNGDLSISYGLQTAFGDTPADAIQASIGGLGG
jgi:hypothetical protein